MTLIFNFCLLLPGRVSWRPTTIKWWQFSQSNRHFTISTRQTEYHEALPSSANDEVRCDCTFTNNGNALWHSVCWMLMVEWRLDCEDCRHLTVVGLHNTGPWSWYDINFLSIQLPPWPWSDHPSWLFIERQQPLPPWPSERKILGSNPACAGIFPGSSHTSDLKIGTPVATLPGAGRYRVSAGTGWPGVSILWMDEIESWICNFYLNVATHKIVWADPSLRYTRLLLGR